MPKIDFKLYLITNRQLLPPNIFLKKTEELLKSGVSAVQIREKDLPARRVITLTEQIGKLCQRYSAKIFISYRAEIMQAIRIDGVHLPEQGFPINGVRRLVGNKLIGKSTHSIESAIQAESEGADFITFGPIYDTLSKREYGSPLGIEKLREVVKHISIPVLAIGGINPERARESLGAGAYGVAVISDLFLSESSQNRMEEYLKILNI